MMVVTDANANPEKAKQITANGAEVLFCPADVKSNLDYMIAHIGRRGVQHLLVEGGPTVIGSFLKEGLADEVVVYIAPKILGRQGNADISKSMNRLGKNIDLHYVDTKHFGQDIRIAGLTQKGLEEISIPSK